MQSEAKPLTDEEIAEIRKRCATRSAYLERADWPEGPLNDAVTDDLRWLAAIDDLKRQLEASEEDDARKSADNQRLYEENAQLRSELERLRSREMSEEKIEALAQRIGDVVAWSSGWRAIADCIREAIGETK